MESWQFPRVLVTVIDIQSQNFRGELKGATSSCIATLYTFQHIPQMTILLVLKRLYSIAECLILSAAYLAQNSACTVMKAKLLVQQSRALHHPKQTD